MYKYTCNVCQKEFDAVHKNRKFCSRKCYFSTRFGENNPQWKGGKRITSHGYIVVTPPRNHPKRKSKNNGWIIFEHRHVMEGHIGRYLKSNEFVHHINGIKTDNRIENLIILTKSLHNTNHFKSPLKTCTISSCNSPFFAKKLCKTHYHREWARKNRNYLPKNYKKP